MIHHVTFEINKRKLAEELQFWSMLGFNPTGLRRRSRKQPPIHWLVSGDESHAVELLAVDKPSVWGLGHVSYELDQRRWQIMAVNLKDCRGARYEPATPHFGNARAFLHSPSGHVVEVIHGSPSVKAGPPLEEE